MWFYEKKLQYPVRVSKCDVRMAKFLIEQYGGSDGELAAALRYLNQRYTVPDKVIGVLNDIGTEELAHLEMIATMVYKLTKDATPEELEKHGLGEHYANHDKALFYNNAAGVPFSVTYIAAKGDPIADLYEDIAAEEKARATYQWLINMTDDPDLKDSLSFLREREIVHSQRFREAVEILKEERDHKKIF
ncbi:MULTISPECIES: manganese catalase family protein [Aneurinibacillus]|uniref:Manganese catalase family protein n=1 Tax=Aneurinibacillus thermoaerophilus TaxID=143495 RepID=A0A1G7YJC8_ANETH|nr:MULTISPECIES: manganese catalase family protein [Aneurinibacillus]AMA73848.1 spore coat protein CotJC [Aneurinibacillus sp. XH2]MED0676683.1 manganese catalase family protein [Aneurinibacillus thermoaerophilus]MED0679329.1 manganese catalase family protein [Aneurinibacillus thermoaerophilus]MED0738099.1 manganese catalase family protein [Aneurinibacillus thermoaerophilus]MED0756520.1 manganese catalase family protein [Aneurinibacillus thermoaerophilus]